VRVEFCWFVCARCGSRVGHAPSVAGRVFCHRCAPSPNAERDAVARRILREAGLLDNGAV
jgi:hypothetical protein